MLQKYFPADEQSAFFAVTEKLSDSILKNIMENCNSNDSRRLRCTQQAMTPLRIMMLNLDRLSGLSITNDEVVKLKEYLVERGMCFRTNNDFMRNKVGNVPAFLAKPKLDSTPSNSITYHSSGNFITNAYRHYLDILQRTNIESDWGTSPNTPEEFESMFGLDAPHATVDNKKVRDRFIFILRCAMNDKFLEKNIPILRNSDRDFDWCRDNTNRLNNYIIESAKEVFAGTGIIDTVIRNKVSVKFLIEPFMYATYGLDDADEYRLQSVSPNIPKRKFKRNCAALESMLAFWYPIFLDIYRFRLECLEFEDILPPRLDNITAVHVLDEILLSHAEIVMEDDVDAMQIMEDEAYSIRTVATEWNFQSDSDRQFWPSWRADMEHFNNSFWGANSNDDLKIIHTREFRKYYKEDAYAKDVPGGSLWGSCMRHESTNQCIEFYEAAGAELLIIKNDEGKILSRAVLWPSARIVPHLQRDVTKEKEPETGSFLDRVYYTHDWIIHRYISYAREKGWYYKQNQNYSSQRKIVTPDRKVKTADVQVPLPKAMKVYMHKMPYMDTLEYVDVKNNLLLNYLPKIGTPHYCYNSGLVVRPRFTPKKKEWIMELTKFPKSDGVVMESVIWQMRGTSQRPTRMYDRFENTESRRSSCNFTKRFGFLAYTQGVSVGSNINTDGTRNYIDENIPRNLAYYCEYNERFFDTSYKTPDGYYDGYAQGTRPPIREYDADTTGKFKDKWVKVKIRVNRVRPSEDVYDIIPKLGAVYCPGERCLVPNKSLRSGSSILIDDRKQRCSNIHIHKLNVVNHQEWIQSFINYPEYSFAERLASVSLDVKSPNPNAETYIFSSFLDCYVLCADAIHIDGFGITSIQLLGSHAESIKTRYEALQKRLASSVTKVKGYAKIKSSEVLEDYREFIK